MVAKNETTTMVLALFVTGGLVAGGMALFRCPLLNWCDAGPVGTTLPLEARISMGDRLLITANASAEKKEGIQRFAARKLTEASQQFQASLAQPNHKNDPEALIYLNNAQVADRKPLKLAVSVPIGSNLNVAQEILRGVAQAQTEINAQGGINGAGLQVVIANDDNDPEIVSKVAQAFVKDASILGVIGHNASNASLKAAPIYQEGKLVMMSPTSFANSLTEIGDYIFRAVPPTRMMAETLANYVVKTDRRSAIALCYDSKAPDNISFRNEFTTGLVNAGARYITTVPCDFSAPDFNARTVVPQLISAGADGILLTPHIDRLDRALEVARVSQGKLSLYSSVTLNTFKTLQIGQNDVNGLILSVPWHPSIVNNPAFIAKTKELWGGQVNWRTAMAYDTTRVLAAGLTQTPTRQGLQQTIAQPGFTAPATEGTVEFLPSRDRNGKGFLVRVEPGGVSGTGYDFVLLTP